MSWRSWLVPIVLTILTCFALALVGNVHFAKNRAMASRARRIGEPIPVRTDVVMKQTVEELIGATIVTEPSEVASIWVGPGVGFTDVRVTMVAVKVEEGQRVERGQLMFELEDELFSLTVKQKEMELVAAEAQLKAVEKLRNRNAASESELRNAKMQNEIAQLDLKVAKRDHGRCKVTSPIDGYVGPIETVLGEQFSASEELTLIYKLDPIHIRMELPLTRIDKVSVGQEAEIVLDSFPSESFHAKVVRISAMVDEETRVLPVILAMENPGGRIKAGITGFGRLRINRNVTTVPSVAVVQNGDRAMVFSIEEGRARIREVRTGVIVDVGVLEIKEGLEAGEEIVIHGHADLRDEDPVNVQWREFLGRE